eukprot:1158580-Pelagomonas_calceolata.AAC.2
MAAGEPPARAPGSSAQRCRTYPAPSIFSFATSKGSLSLSTFSSTTRQRLEGEWGAAQRECVCVCVCRRQSGR